MQPIAGLRLSFHLHLARPRRGRDDRRSLRHAMTTLMEPLEMALTSRGPTQPIASSQSRLDDSRIPRGANRALQ